MWDSLPIILDPHQSVSISAGAPNQMTIFLKTNQKLYTVHSFFSTIYDLGYELNGYQTYGKFDKKKGMSKIKEKVLSHMCGRL